MFPLSPKTPPGGYVLPVCCVLVSLWLFCGCAGAEAAPGRVWRIAYMEGGSHPVFVQTLGALARALHGQGLIAAAPPSEPADDGPALWRWLSRHAGGDHVEFLSDGYYSAGWKEDAGRADMRTLLRRIRERGDVDLILAMGAAAGKAMATAEHAVPTFVLAVADPVGAGLSRTGADSGQEHVYVQALPYSGQRQLGLFHSMFHFSRLGVMYEDTPEGRAFSGVRQIEDAAGNYGFSLVRCPLDPGSADRPEQMRRCMARLAEEADAVYLTFAAARQGVPPGQVLAPLIRAGLPTFSQAGVEDTRRGVLMSLSRQSCDETAEATVRALRGVMAGQSPRSLSGTANPRLGLALNLRMAMLIDWDPPLEALVAADELCDQVITDDASPQTP